MALDFPSNPVNGQAYDNFVYDSAKGTWRSLSSGASPNYLVNPTITDAVITATATTPSTIPLTVNGAASQSANLQEWKNSAGIALANIDQYGSFKTNYTESSIPHIVATNSSSANTSYNYILAGANDTGTKAVHFVNSSTRTVDNGADTYTIRNNGGNLVLGSTSYDTTIYNRVLTPTQPAFRAYYPSAGSGANVTFSGNDSGFSGRNAGWNGSSRFTAPVAGVYNFSFSFLVNDAVYYARTLFRINGTYNTQYGDNLASTYGVYNVSAMSMTFRLNANDYVELYNEGAPIYGSSYGSFSGFLVG